MNLIVLNNAVHKNYYFSILLVAGTWVPAFFASTPQQVLYELRHLAPAKRLERCRALVEQYGALGITDVQMCKNLVRHYETLHAQTVFCAYWREQDQATYVRFSEQYFSAVAYCFVLSVQEAFVHRHDKEYCAAHMQEVALWYDRLNALLPCMQASVYCHRYEKQMMRYQNLCVLLSQEVA